MASKNVLVPLYETAASRKVNVKIHFDQDKKLWIDYTTDKRVMLMSHPYPSLDPQKATFIDKIFEEYTRTGYSMEAEMSFGLNQDSILKQTLSDNF